MAEIIILSALKVARAQRARKWAAKPEIACVAEAFALERGACAARMGG
jgi:hypothetical protein